MLCDSASCAFYKGSTIWVRSFEVELILLYENKYCFLFFIVVCGFLNHKTQYDDLTSRMAMPMNLVRSAFCP